VPARPEVRTNLRLLLCQVFAGPAERYFIVLRNDETLPVGLSGTDLDVCVRPGRTPREVVDYLVASTGKLGWFPVGMSERPHMVGFTLIRQDTADVEAIHFDVFNGISYLGIPLCPALVLDQESSIRDGVRVLSDRGKALATLLHHMAWNGHLSKEKYRAELADVLTHPPDAAWVERHTAVAFGEPAAHRLLSSSSVSPLYHGTLSNRLKLAAAVVHRAAGGNPFRPARQIMAYWAGQWSSFRFPPGLVGTVGDRYPEWPNLRLTEELACSIAPHGCAAPSARAQSRRVHTLNGPRYQRATCGSWKRWTPVRWLLPSVFLFYQAKRNRVVVLSNRLPIGLRILRHLRAPAWVGATPGKSLEIAQR
jgi:hypothetical protein